MREKETYYTMIANNGMPVSIPGSKLQAWLKQQKEETKHREATVLYDKEKNTSGSDLTAENVPLGNTKEVSSDGIVSQDV